MGCEEAPRSRGDAAGRQVVDAVENLVALWFAAVEDVTPRLPARQVRALRIVRRRPELNLTALAEQLDIGLPTASRMCDRLEAAGLLERNAQPDDRREVQLVVTPHGRRYLTEVTDRLSAYLTTALDGLPPGQRTVLEEVLRAFHEAQGPVDTRPEREAPADR
ncbi:MarR family winged helix-turn-helix transcriptional regulator [Streptomyces spongiae]|uniref:Winged helix-turn-helix transcriptional regulator n=1 Tax=Streptomyces spongiae TaxID=565072 RepID=A0A5N8XL69_9ACTN|nr:MarR family winged helix-turn-helix transcriptional regulator [Streptomyces spongiae]MPY60213.1 winged helix-turn-helix transcriptional regulator [Streptomyces spongiae]